MHACVRCDRGKNIVSGVGWGRWRLGFRVKRFVICGSLSNLISPFLCFSIMMRCNAIFSEPTDNQVLVLVC